MMDDLSSSVHMAFSAIMSPQAPRDDPEMDKKTFLPRRLSTRNLSQHVSDSGSAYRPGGLGVWSHSQEDIPSLNLDAKGEGKSEGKEEGKYAEGKPTTPDAKGQYDFPKSDSKSDVSMPNRPKRALSMEVKNSKLHPDVEVSELLLAAGDSAVSSVSRSPRPPSTLSLPDASPVPQALSLPPTWDPQSPFCFPVAEMPTKLLVPDNLNLDSFERVQHLADGSNANVFCAVLNKQACIIKMIRAEVQNDPVAVHEFDCEHGMLVRFSHPNIIRVMGAGRYPRRFIVLEYLANGSLHSALSSNINKGDGFFHRHKPTFPWRELLSKGLDLADAFDYLHRRCCDGATVIHRDLKVPSWDCLRSVRVCLN